MYLPERQVVGPDKGILLSSVAWVLLFAGGQVVSQGGCMVRPRHANYDHPADLCIESIHRPTGIHSGYSEYSESTSNRACDSVQRKTHWKHSQHLWPET